MTYKQAKAEIQKNQAAMGHHLPLASGQTPNLPGPSAPTAASLPNARPEGQEEQNGADEMQVDAGSSEARDRSEQQLQLEMRGRPTNGEARGARVDDLVTNGADPDSDV